MIHFYRLLVFQFCFANIHWHIPWCRHNMFEKCCHWWMIENVYILLQAGGGIPQFYPHAISKIVFVWPGVAVSVFRQQTPKHRAAAFGSGWRKHLFVFPNRIKNSRLEADVSRLAIFKHFQTIFWKNLFFCLVSPRPGFARSFWLLPCVVAKRQSQRFSRWQRKASQSNAQLRLGISMPFDIFQN